MDILFLAASQNFTAGESQGYGYPAFPPSSFKVPHFGQIQQMTRELMNANHKGQVSRSALDTFPSCSVEKCKERIWWTEESQHSALLFSMNLHHFSRHSKSFNHLSSTYFNKGDLLLLSHILQPCEPFLKAQVPTFFFYFLNPLSSSLPGFFILQV